MTDSTDSTAELCRLDGAQVGNTIEGRTLLFLLQLSRHCTGMELSHHCAIVSVKPIRGKSLKVVSYASDAVELLFRLLLRAIGLVTEIMFNILQRILKFIQRSMG